MYVAGDSGNENLDAYKKPGDKTFFGSGYPLTTWVEYMQTATKGQEVKQFDKAKPIQGKSIAPSESPSPSVQPSQSQSAHPSPSGQPTEESSAEGRRPTSEPTDSDRVTPSTQPTRGRSSQWPTKQPTNDGRATQQPTGGGNNLPTNPGDDERGPGGGRQEDRNGQGGDNGRGWEED